jgi:peptidoglycan/LPS O-acetylase OafA/YrhL
MPLYLLVLHDLALGRGLLGLGVGMAMAMPGSKTISFWFAVIGLTVMAMISTYWIEKPLAKRLRRKLQPAQGFTEANPGTGFL